MLDDGKFHVNSCSKCINMKTKGLSLPCRTCLIDRKGKKLNFNVILCFECAKQRSWKACESCDDSYSNFEVIK